MSFISTGFVLFFVFAAVIFYLVPQKIKWIILLAFSYIFYALNDVKAVIFILFSTAVSFFAAKVMDKISAEYEAKLLAETDKKNRKEIRAECKKKKKVFASAGVVSSFLVLAVLKYANFFLSNAAGLAGFFGFDFKFRPFDFILPLGISFYSFQVVSYILDVYNGKYRAEKNFFHYALYVSYFPSILQGPISRYDEMKFQFFEKEHRFSLKNTQFAFQRILWGFLKKLVIADRAAEVVSYVFENHSVLPWYIVFCGLIFYSIQLYADFSGGMDVVLGVSELFDVKLAENFRQPFFSQSISEFWRRWHITLGTWMKDYVFYPLSLSKFSASLGKKISGRNRYLGKTVPACLANLIVFFIVGVWHGAENHFIVYGLYNGFLIVLGIMFEPIFSAWSQKMKADKFMLGGGAKTLRILRTFVLVNIGWVFDDVKDLKQSFSLLKRLFSFNTFGCISNFKFIDFSEKTIFVVLFFSILWFVVSVLKEKGISIRESLSGKPLILRWAVYIFLILSVPFFQSANMAGFIYAQF